MKSYESYEKKVYWIRTTQDKMLQPQKCTFLRKRVHKLKTIIFYIS